MTDAKNETPKNVVITGGTAGIGFQTAIKLAEKGYVVTISARSDTKGKEAVEAILKSVPGAKVDYLVLDLESLESVKKFAKTYSERSIPLHILINNAGAIIPSFGLSKDGIELSWQVNHLSHFLLTYLLWPRLQAAGAARVVNVSSNAHTMWSQPFELKSVVEADSSYQPFPAYGRSKLANILFTRGLESRLKGKGVTFFSLHPGMVNTPGAARAKPQLDALGIDFTKAIPEVDGCKTSVYLATTPGIENLSGGYFDDCKLEKPSEIAQSKDEEDKVWAASIKLLNLPANAFA